MSFELSNLDGSSNDSFTLDGHWRGLPLCVPPPVHNSELSASRTAPTFLVPPPFAEFHNENRSQNLNIFSSTFDEVVRASISQTPSRTSLVEQGTRKNEAPKWRPEEDSCLVELVQKFGPRKWKEVAQHIAQRTGFALREPDAVSERWSRVINPEINKSKWSEEEIQLLISAVKQCEPKQWKEIADKIPGRTDIEVRYELSRIRETLIARGIEEDYLPE